MNSKTTGKTITGVILSLMLLISYSSLFGQGAAVNTSGAPPDNSAIFDVSSNQKGMLMPRMTEQERNAIVNPADGLLIFNTTTKCINIYTNSFWGQICPNCIPPGTPVASNNGPHCSGDTLRLFASTVPGATAYSWTGPNGFTSSAQNPIIINAGVLSAGTYQVTALSNTCSGSPASTSAIISPVPASTFSSVPSSPSINQNCTFSPTLSGASYSWTFQSGNPSTSTQQNPVVQWANTGTYNVSLTVTQNGCSSTTTSQISIISCYVHNQSQTFTATGSIQNWIVPAGVCSVTIECWGGQGGKNGNNQQFGGLGGYATGSHVVNPGDSLFIFVGQSGDNGGFNGGGSCIGTYAGGKGGGASDVRIGGKTLNDRIIVAGGGGGAAGYSGGYGGWQGGQGGNGGGSNGDPGITNTPYGSGGSPGGGGTQTAGGVYGTDGGNSGGCITGTASSFGLGGRAGGNTNDCGSGGSGGGGWYGGGGGGFGNCGGGGGGGGSSYIGGVTGGSTTSGSQSGDGSVKISY
ncbi:MAG: glycine-rich protein [Bacteroidota bacterium]